MKITIDQDNLYLNPIEIGEYESVEVLLPGGESVRVFSDMVYLQSADDRAKHKDGKKIWDKKTK